MKFIFFRMKQRHSLYIMLVSLLSFSLLGVIIYKSVGEMFISHSRTNAMGLAVIAANEIDGDKFETIRSKDNDEFYEVYELLDKYKDFNMLQYIYTMRMEDDVLTFVVDADPDDPAGCGEEYNLLEDMIPAFHGQVCCDKKLTKDKWGKFFSAYAPIFNSDHEVVGIVGCDITTADITRRLAILRNVIVFLISVFAALCLLMLILISRDMVNTDSLTEIANDNKIKNIAARLKRKNKLKDYTGMLVNIKDFKYINQKIGFNGGDELLREYAGQLKKMTRQGEFVARTGNDNFLMLIKKGREDEVLKKLSPMDINMSAYAGLEDFKIYSRCGMYSVGEDDVLSSVMNYCTLAVNSTRKAENDDYVWYEDFMIKQLLEDKNIVAKYKEALKNGEFQVYYQPKVNIDTRTLCGAEALVRWVKEGTIISPARFIPVLEREGKIIDLDFYVFEQVCKDIRRWMDEGIKPVRISSNFSKLHLKNEHLSEDVLAIVRRYDIDTAYIEIELTESSGYSDFDALQKFVRDMNEVGIYTSIDDFGTGYSSLSMLKDIDVNVVKIDKSFFDNMEDEKQHGTNLVGNVIRMIKDLDRIVICEGVETEKQVMFLKGTECNIVQGYLFDKPLPCYNFEERLKTPVY